MARARGDLLRRRPGLQTASEAQGARFTHTRPCGTLHPPTCFASTQYRQEFEEIENIEYAKSLKERRKLMTKMQSAGDMSGMEEL